MLHAISALLFLGLVGQTDALRIKDEAAVFWGGGAVDDQPLAPQRYLLARFTLTQGGRGLLSKCDVGGQEIVLANEALLAREPGKAEGNTGVLLIAVSGDRLDLRCDLVTDNPGAFLASKIISRLLEVVKIGVPAIAPVNEVWSALSAELPADARHVVLRSLMLGKPCTGHTCDATVPAHSTLLFTRGSLDRDDVRDLRLRGRQLVLDRKPLSLEGVLIHFESVDGDAALFSKAARESIEQGAVGAVPGESCGLTAMARPEDRAWGSSACQLLRELANDRLPETQMGYRLIQADEVLAASPLPATNPLSAAVRKRSEKLLAVERFASARRNLRFWEQSSPLLEEVPVTCAQLGRLDAVRAEAQSHRAGFDDSFRRVEARAKRAQAACAADQLHAEKADFLIGPLLGTAPFVSLRKLSPTETVLGLSSLGSLRFDLLQDRAEEARLLLADQAEGIKDLRLATQPLRDELLELARRPERDAAFLVLIPPVPTTTGELRTFVLQYGAARHLLNREAVLVARDRGEGATGQGLTGP